MAVEFAQGESFAELVIPTLNDDVSESRETALLTLEYPYKLTVGETSQATLTIADDEPQRGEFSLSSDVVSVVEGAGEVSVTINRSNGSNDEVTLRVFTADDGQVAGVDYEAIDEEITFADGETEKQISIIILDENTDDAETGFTVNISSETATITTDSISITIVDNDNPSSPTPPTPPVEGSKGGGTFGLGLLVLILLRLVFNRHY